MLLAIAAGQQSPVDPVSAPERPTSEGHSASQKSNLRVDLQGHGSGLQNPANDNNSPRQRQWRRVETNIDTAEYPYSPVDMTYAQPPQAPPQQSWGTLWDASGAFHNLL
ncbi:hypothetical protein APHAL10511_007337 [Amanita phalloides]|nr:hypothetical protein APHAL10511_007337 [Amanita phalloides]